MRERIRFYWERVKAGRLQEMMRQTRWIYGYAKRYWLIMILYTLIGMSGTVVSLITSLISKDLVDMITGHESGKLVATFAAMIGTAIASTIIGLITDYVSGWISMRVDAEIKSDIFEKILVTDWESLTHYHTGDLLTRWSGDASKISNGILGFIPNLFMSIFRFISAFAVVAYHDITFAFFAFASMPVSLILSKTLMNRMVDKNKKSAQMGARMSGFNQEAFSNVQTIKAFDLIPYYVNKLKNLQKEYITMSLDFKKMSIGTSLLMTAVGLVVTYATYGWGIYRVWSGAITYGTMTMFLSLTGTLSSSLKSLTGTIPTAISLTTSAGRLMDIVEMPREDFSKSDEVEDFAMRHRKQGIHLVLQDVNYSYQNGTEVFRGACLEANPHEVVALVGPSGEGKTTMLRLLLSLILPGEGEAFIQSEDEKHQLERIPLSASARRVFSYVPQGNSMFSGTIAENMRTVKPDATDEEIVEVLKLACAWDFVEKLPDGIESVIKERGGGFSEGQAQRLSIARALLRKSPILLLDEATSALDVATERRVLRNIMQDTYPRTCIVTTHRPTVLQACTRVYAIKDKHCEVLDEAAIDQLVRDF